MKIDAKDKAPSEATNSAKDVTRTWCRNLFELFLALRITRRGRHVSGFDRSSSASESARRTLSRRKWIDAHLVLGMGSNGLQAQDIHAYPSESRTKSFLPTSLERLREIARTPRRSVSTRATEEDRCDACDRCHPVRVHCASMVSRPTCRREPSCRIGKTTSRGRTTSNAKLRISTRTSSSFARGRGFEVWETEEGCISIDSRRDEASFGNDVRVGSSSDRFFSESWKEGIQHVDGMVSRRETNDNVRRLRFIKLFLERAASRHVEALVHGRCMDDARREIVYAKASLISNPTHVRRSFLSERFWTDFDGILERATTRRAQDHEEREEDGSSSSDLRSPPTSSKRRTKRATCYVESSFRRIQEPCAADSLSEEHRRARGTRTACEPMRATSRMVPRSLLRSVDSDVPTMASSLTRAIRIVARKNRRSDAFRSLRSERWDRAKTTSP